MHLQIIIGSIREGRTAKPVADWVHERAARNGEFTVELIDLKEWGLPLLDFSKPPIMGDYKAPLQQKWADTVRKGDAYLFISPEYNHGYSPVLKNALDYIYGEWVRKPAGCIGYGSVEGGRGIEQLRQVMIELQMAPIRDAVHIRDVWGKIKDGRFHAADKDEQSLDKVLGELAWWSNALASARKAGAG